MRIVERYLASSLARNAFFTFLVLASVVTMMVFSMVALRESMSFLTVSALLEVVALLSMTQLEVLIPLTVLIAAIWTYGKSQADGEVNAMREAGVPLRRILQPSLLVGATGTLILAFLGNEIVPDAYFEQRRAGKRFLAESVDRLLDDDRNTIQDRRFKCRWESVGIDEKGRPFLRQFVVAELGKEGGPAVFTRAGRALPFIDGQQGRLILELQDLTYSVLAASDRMSIALDLRALSEEPAPRQRVDYMNYAELMSMRLREAGQKLGYQADTELQARAAAAVSSLLFAYLGAALGVLFGIRNRAFIFAIGFLLVLVLYYAPRLVGESLAETGSLAPGLAMWSGNFLIIVASYFAWQKTRRR